jgi:ABC-type transporter Mla subunit MlaD
MSDAIVCPATNAPCALFPIIERDNARTRDELHEVIGEVQKLAGKVDRQADVIGQLSLAVDGLANRFASTSDVRRIESLAREAKETAARVDEEITKNEQNAITRQMQQISRERDEARRALELAQQAKPKRSWLGQAWVSLVAAVAPHLLKGVLLKGVLLIGLSVLGTLLATAQSCHSSVPELTRPGITQTAQGVTAK